MEVIDFLQILVWTVHTTEVDAKTKEVINNIARNFTFMHLFYDRLAKVGQNIAFLVEKGIREDVREKYSKCLQQVVWLLFGLIRKAV
jgi:hypothetical protein